MYDEGAAKAEAATEFQRDASPVQTEMARLHEVIGVLGNVTEKLRAALQPVLRSEPPSPDRNDAVKAVDDRSDHVREIASLSRLVEAIAQSTRSMLERLEVW